MKNITIQCDRCGKLVEGCIAEDGTCTGGYYNVAEGYWSLFARWEEENVCDQCMFNDPKYIKLYYVPPSQ